MDVSMSQKSATYEQIKVYVLEKFGFKASFLGEAQMWSGCGAEL